MTEESRELAEKHGLRSGKGLRLVSRAVAKLKGVRDDGDD